ncbi:hypothetical protein K5X82_06385 [Halosquirtibacter xylanolyticus]|uniref:hypothetical protein n=1 Tax=Halosquirtibacter xylanolyticus TaxID=3374599 RepID=UPI0037493AE6|nr:hypothetical protein K5X82_06385 [Prolixibacteraceae bacterium]
MSCTLKRCDQFVIQTEIKDIKSATEISSEQELSLRKIILKYRQDFRHLQDEDFVDRLKRKQVFKTALLQKEKSIYDVIGARAIHDYQEIKTENKKQSRTLSRTIYSLKEEISQFENGTRTTPVSRTSKAISKDLDEIESEKQSTLLKNNLNEENARVQIAYKYTGNARDSLYQTLNDINEQKQKFSIYHSMKEQDDAKVVKIELGLLNSVCELSQSQRQQFTTNSLESRRKIREVKNKFKKPELTEEIKKIQVTYIRQLISVVGPKTLNHFFKAKKDYERSFKEIKNKERLVRNKLSLRKDHVDPSPENTTEFTANKEVATTIVQQRSTTNDSLNHAVVKLQKQLNLFQRAFFLYKRNDTYGTDKHIEIISKIKELSPKEERLIRKSITTFRKDYRKAIYSVHHPEKRAAVCDELRSKEMKNISEVIGSTEAEQYQGACLLVLNMMATTERKLNDLKRLLNKEGGVSIKDKTLSNKQEVTNLGAGIKRDSLMILLDTYKETQKELEKQFDLNKKFDQSIINSYIELIYSYKDINRNNDKAVRNAFIVYRDGLRSLEHLDDEKKKLQYHDDYTSMLKFKIIDKLGEDVFDKFTTQQVKDEKEYMNLCVKITNIEKKLSL